VTISELSKVRIKGRHVTRTGTALWRCTPTDWIVQLDEPTTEYDERTHTRTTHIRLSCREDQLEVIE
jgi:hypothetical protein